MKNFLRSIAKAYTERYNDLSEICFLFPNKRSSLFFESYLKEYSNKNYSVSPELMTITDFVGFVSGKVQASRIELLFILFNCYKEEFLKRFPELALDDDLNNEKIDFESFRIWGETVLSDFSTVDQYLVEADKLFRNVRSYREISSNFLTQEQKDIIKLYFGHSEPEDNGRLWRDFDEEGEGVNNAEHRFLQLWRIMDDLYHIFNEKLNEEGLATTGGMYKAAFERLTETGKSALPFKKIVAIGFNALSFSEISIFKELKSFDKEPGYDDYIDFIWDATGPVLTESENSASKFINLNKEMFPTAEWLQPYLSESDETEMPKITVIRTPSNAGQTKIAKEIIQNLLKNKEDKTLELTEHAVILPNENLLIPMLYSLPEELDGVNLTMGYSFRMTSLASFISTIRRLFITTKISGSEMLFYHTDLKMLLSHPYAYFFFGRESIEKVRYNIDHYHKKMITLSWLIRHDSEFGRILRLPPKDSDATQIIDFIDEILTELEEKLKSCTERRELHKLDLAHINLYKKSLSQLDFLMEKYSMEMEGISVFLMIDRLLINEKITFQGEPLKGLQIMGTLETRCLDFENITILSMNENIMPRRSRSRTFIPDVLRYAMGMPPARYSEEIFAYYFYRMISRAKHVYLVYDGRTSSGLSAAGESRYIYQLRHLYCRDHLIEKNAFFNFSSKKIDDSTIEKSDDLLLKLNTYLLPGGTNLSASSLNTYRECQVKFCLQNILKINTDPPASEYIDAITVGNVLHHVMMELYIKDDSQWEKWLDHPIEISEKTIKDIFATKNLIMDKVTRNINYFHYHRFNDNTPLTGASELIGKQIKTMVKYILSNDLKFTPFKLLGCEIKENMRIKTPEGRKVNFKFAIDRLDEITVNGSKTLRIIDYKTGGKKREAKKFEDLFGGDYKSEQVFQLFTYAWLLGKKGIEGAEKVQTEIYSIPDIVKGERGFPKIEKQTVDCYEPYKDAFNEGILKMIDTLFDSPVFAQSETENQCRFCEFKVVCGK